MWSPSDDRLSSDSRLKLALRLGTFDAPVVERLRQGGFGQLAPRLLAGGLIVFAILYVLVIAKPVPAGPASTIGPKKGSLTARLLAGVQVAPPSSERV